MHAPEQENPLTNLAQKFAGKQVPCFIVAFLLPLIYAGEYVHETQRYLVSLPQHATTDFSALCWPMDEAWST